MFEQFNDIASMLSQEFGNTKGNKKEYKKVPVGKYEVKVENMQLGTNKAEDKPMFKVQFKILNGEYENSCLFMNQIITKPFHLKIVNDFLRSLKAFNSEIKFTDFKNYQELINEVFGLIQDKVEFALEYTNENGFDKFRITDVFELPF